MDNLSTPLWWIFGVLVVIFFHLGEGKPTRSVTMHAVQCYLEGRAGHRDCRYAPFDFVLTANLARDEVVLSVEGDESVFGSQLFSECIIVDPKNFSCGWRQWPKEERYKSPIMLTDGKYFRGFKEENILTCYPSLPIRWAIALGIFSAAYDESATVRDLLNCTPPESFPLRH